jgi:tetratricopeptide (TPR) repeat protein
MAVDASDDASKAQKRAAGLGKAKCLAQAGKAAEAVSLVLSAIRQASPEEREMLAGAYNTLGAAQRAAGKDQDALIAFLTVDLVYNSVPEAHAEALANLVELWQKANNPERSRQAMQSLETTYPDSPWVKSAKATVGKT